jgi:hypothetical protein
MRALAGFQTSRCDMKHHIDSTDITTCYGCGQRISHADAKGSHKCDPKRIASREGAYSREYGGRTPTFGERLADGFSLIGDGEPDRAGGGDKTQIRHTARLDCPPALPLGPDERAPFTIVVKPQPITGKAKRRTKRCPTGTPNPTGS